jgi:hypothetical protein
MVRVRHENGAHRRASGHFLEERSGERDGVDQEKAVASFDGTGEEIGFHRRLKSLPEPKGRGELEEIRRGRHADVAP